MTRTIFATAALIIATVVPAAAMAEDRSFTRDGETYVYTTTPRDGSTLIEGRSMQSGSRFRLTVRGGRVTGTAGGQQVSFTVPIELAQR